MEAFPAILLLTADPVLAAAIPAQLRHAGAGEATVVESWQALQAAPPPALALVDCAACGGELGAIGPFRKQHPLVALVGIGTAEQAEYFSALPLAAFVHRPVSMPALLHSVEHLGYERAMTAGQQNLGFPQGAVFSPADRCIRKGGAELELTDKETAMLLCLYHHRHGWLPRQQLLEEVWGYSDTIATHTLETHLYRLRGKLRECFGEEEVVVTRQGTYRLRL